MNLLSLISPRTRRALQAQARVDEGRAKAERGLCQEMQRLGAERRAAPLPAEPGGTPLVMGLAAHYGPRELAPFVASLRGTGYDGDVVLLTYGCQPDTAAYLRRHRVRMVPFHGLGAMAMSMNSSRMHRYLDVLLESALNAGDPAPNGPVLLTDVRDVVFQANPFPFPQAPDAGPPASLVFFMETHRTIGSCPINADWMQRAYGANVAASLAAQPISCAGTLMGTRAGVTDYLCHMLAHLAAVPPEHRFSGVDQAIHNHILAKRLVPGTVTSANGDWVLTVPHGAGSGITLRDRQILNPDGRVAPVVHQYDRDSALLSAVNGWYTV